ncbi:MAG TPA: hypothetical protein VHZ73_01310 [Vicinamibacterales bacterium]|jgi:hypothetical protein|nr:hypothetical protein [Vicinamibacterales bacterium]
MELTSRSLWTLAHGMGFGGLYLLACSGAVIEIRRLASSQRETRENPETFLRCYLFAMVALAWCAVLSGTYAIYPWYRAVAPAGTVDLSAFPQRLLLSNAGTAAWHSFGMEWKEHVAWLTPVSITMAAAVVSKYGRQLGREPHLRTAVLAFVFVSFFAAAVAGFFGAMLDKAAPVGSPAAAHLLSGE